MPVLLPLEGFKQECLKKALEFGGFDGGNIKFSEKECFLQISDLKRWAQLAWSYLGFLPGGRSQNDEDQWGEAITNIVEHLEKGDGVSKNGNGETVLRMVACTAIAKR